MNQKELIMASMELSRAARRNRFLRTIEREPKPLPAVEPEPMPDPMPVNPGTVDINTATLDELTAISGLGVTIANGITAGRPWASLAELESNVRGVSWARIEAWGLRCG